MSLGPELQCLVSLVHAFYQHMQTTCPLLFLHFTISSVLYSSLLVLGSGSKVRSTKTLKRRSS